MTKRLQLIRFLHELGLIEVLPGKDEIWTQQELPIAFYAAQQKFDESIAIEKIASKLAIENIQLDPSTIDYAKVTELVEKLGAEYCLTQRITPLSETNNQIVVAFADPLDLDTIKSIEFRLSKSVHIAIAKESEILLLLSEFITPEDELFEQFQDLPASDYVEILGRSSLDQEIDKDGVSTPPILKLTNKIMGDGVKARASDIHIEPMQSAVSVRFRIDGVMSNVLEIPKRLQSYITTRFKLLASMDISERRRPQDGRFRVRIAGDVVDLRVSSLPTAYGETIVLRLLRPRTTQLSIESLAMPKQICEAVMRALNGHAKMLLVTGPTGSGKSTTLYTFLHYLKNGRSNIVTVEDPIEYKIAGINQLQVNEAAQVTFASALRSVLRQDPDLIMVGEIRDSETANIALQSAQTGHKVLSTLHTNDAVAAIARLKNLSIAPYLIASSLAGVLAQRLVRKLCQECAVELTPEHDQAVIEDLKLRGIDYKSVKKAHGCKNCSDLGYFGRFAIYSYLEVSDLIAEQIAKGAESSEIANSARSLGFQSLSDSALQALTDGLTSYEEVKPYLEKESRSSINNLAVSEQRLGNSIAKPKLLLVEDNDDVRSVLAMLLEREMFDVIQAANGLEALSKVYAEVPAVILCDLMMPVMDGREFLLKLKNNKQTREIPVIILTAAASEEHEINLLELGARDFVSKASSSNIMLTRIRKVLA